MNQTIAEPAHRKLIAITCAILLATGNPWLRAQAPAAPAQDAAPKIPNDQLDSLVAPIALYPDPMLSQVLVASTYPLELVQLQQWLEKNPTLKDKALADAVMKQPWDPSIQAMAAMPDLVKRLADDVQWTTDMGNAFLAQQSDVMDAVQRMRKKAQDTGALKTTEQQKVETKVVETKTVIVVEQANPQVVYVPSYNPVVVYGPPVYPYPPIYYPPSTGAVIATAAISFGVGMAMGAMWGGGWGYGCGWGGNNVNINVNNNFNRNTNINGGNRNTINGGNRVGNGNTWQHNPSHRGGAPYSDRATANKFGGTARGDSLSNRQAGAKQQISRQGGNVGNSRPGGSNAANRTSGGNFGNNAANRPGVGNTANRPAAGNSVGNRASVGNTANRAGGADRVGSREIPRSTPSSSNRSALGSGSGGFNGGSARASSSRGASSMGARGGGGGRRR